jgi:hypothetical protein
MGWQAGAIDCNLAKLGGVQMASTNSAIPPMYAHSTQTLRLTFAFNEDNVRLIRTQSVAMITPPCVTELPKIGTHSGFWVELQDANRVVLFHRVLHNPMRHLAEVHEPDRSVRLVTGAPGKGEFEALVPDLPEASRVVLFGSLLDDNRSLQPTKELAIFKLKQ